MNFSEYKTSESDNLRVLNLGLQSVFTLPPSASLPYPVNALVRLLARHKRNVNLLHGSRSSVPIS
jgi:hypothetical protein